MASTDGQLAVEEVEITVAGRTLRVLRPADRGAVLDEAAADEAAEPPYWAEIWPAAHALAEVVAAHDLRGRSVLELGAGLALPSLAAARAGGDVVASDADPRPLALIEEAARLNGLTLRTAVADWNRPPAHLTGQRFELVLAADVLYEPPSTDALATLLPRLVAPGGVVLVAAPWREQAERLVTLLRHRGWGAVGRETTAPGWHGRRSPIWVVLLRPGARGTS